MFVAPGWIHPSDPWLIGYRGDSSRNLQNGGFSEGSAPELGQSWYLQVHFSPVFHHTCFTFPSCNMLWFFLGVVFSLHSSRSPHRCLRPQPRAHAAICFSAFLKTASWETGFVFVRLNLMFLQLSHYWDQRLHETSRIRIKSGGTPVPGWYSSSSARGIRRFLP